MLHGLHVLGLDAKRLIGEFDGVGGARVNAPRLPVSVIFRFPKSGDIKTPHHARTLYMYAYITPSPIFLRNLSMKSEGRMCRAYAYAYA